MGRRAPVRVLTRARLQCANVWPATGLQFRTVSGRQPLAARLYVSPSTRVCLRMLETKNKSKQRLMTKHKMTNRYLRLLVHETAYKFTVCRLEVEF